MAQFRIKPKPFLLLILVFLLTLAASAQSKREMKDNFVKANYLYLYRDYSSAVKLYLKLDTPDNFYIKYKIGTCYLNMPGEKEKAIPYLEDASKDASYDARGDSFREKRAPVDVWFYLGKAYMINNDLEKAISTFQKFGNLAKDSKLELKNAGYIDQEIEACKKAIELKGKPVSFNKEPLGSDFRRSMVNDLPAVSFDGQTIVYTEENGDANTIMFARKENGVWQKPRDITQELQAGKDCSSSSLNNDGTEIFLYKTGNQDGEIWTSTFENGSWTPIKKLNAFINTKFYESHASISRDGKKLYFTSNREGGEGNLDIYVSERDQAGTWGPAVNLGPVINTPFNEDNPFITQNDSVLYFCSEGHHSMGGFDNFRSLRNGTGWNEPENLGYPVNSTDDDKFWQPANNEANAYYAMYTGPARKEIFYISLNKTGFRQTAAYQPRDTTTYAALNLKGIPSVPSVDSSILVRNYRVSDVNDKSVNDSDVLYYTVQVIALYNPVDISYFKYVTDIKVMYNDNDYFYRYTTGIFSTREEAEAHKTDLLRKGYPSDIFIKKVSKK